MSSANKDNKMEGTWIAMIGLVASTLVVFVLILIFIVPIDSDVDLVEKEDDILFVQLEKVNSEHFIFKDFTNFKGADSIPESLIKYLSKELRDQKKYTILVRFPADDNFSKGSRYDQAYEEGKTVIQLLVKSAIPIENIRLNLLEDPKITKTLVEILQNK